MDTAGKAVLFSGITVLISLSAVMLVPSPAFRSMALGIMISVVFILAATLTLLPAVLGKLGPKVDKFALPWVHSGEHRSPRFAALGRAPLAAPAALRAAGADRAARAGDPGPRPDDRHAVDQGRARRATPRARATTRSSAAFGPGAPGTLQLVGPAASMRRPPPRSPRPTRASPRSRPPQPGGGGPRADPGGPDDRPVRPAPPARPSTACATTLPAGVLVGGAAAENHDLGGRARRPTRRS